MTVDEFIRRLQGALPVGSVLQNPGGGTSTILSHSQKFVRYRRRRSSIGVAYESLFGAYAANRSRAVSTSDLKRFEPSVFDTKARPAGHDCNGTFLFLVLRQLGLSSDIDGSGKKGDPYFVSIT